MNKSYEAQLQLTKFFKLFLAIIGLIAAITLVSTTFAIEDDAVVEVVAYGTLGEDGAEWRLYEDGVVIVEAGVSGLILDDTYYSPWYDYADYITEIKFTGDFDAGETTAGMFSNLPYLTAIHGLEYFDTSSVVDMSQTFAGAASLESLDLSYWDVSSIGIDPDNEEYLTSEMFEGTYALQVLTIGPDFRFLNIENIGILGVSEDDTDIDYWQNVGDGTICEPAGIYYFTAEELMNHHNENPPLEPEIWVRILPVAEEAPEEPVNEDLVSGESNDENPVYEETESAEPVTIEPTSTDATVVVTTQAGTLIAGQVGTVTFNVTTTNIANGYHPITVTTIPGVTAPTQIQITDGSGALTLSGSATTVATAATNLALTIDGITSNNFTLTISAPAIPTIAVGTQAGILTAGVIAGPTNIVTFPVTTTNVANGLHPITVINLPTGVTAPAQIQITNGSGTLTLSGSATALAGITNNLTLGLTGTTATSSAFTLTVSATASTISVGSQVGTLRAARSGTVTFPVSTTNIPNGTYAATVANLPTGVSVQGQVTITNGSGTLTLAGNTTTLARVTNNLTLTLANTNVTSSAFTLIVAPTATVSVGRQVGTLTAGRAGTVTFPVTTTNIPNGTFTATVANLPAGVTVSGQVTINNNSGTLTLAGSTATLARVTNNLTLTLDGTTSAAFSLTVGGTGQSQPPQTGDNTPLHFWTGLTVLSGVALVGYVAVAVVKQKKS